jgi:hypothetical protein
VRGYLIECTVEMIVLDHLSQLGEETDDHPLDVCVGQQSKGREGIFANTMLAMKTVWAIIAIGSRGSWWA